MEKATFGGGCFWCTEAIFKRVRGVTDVVSGYSGGEKDHPSYKEVSYGTTGHAESIQVTFDPNKISFKDLLYVFFRLHDPTDPGGQGADRGSQYRSVVFYANEDQRKTSHEALREAQKEYDKPLVTQIEKFTAFYAAEEYHQNYYSSIQEDSRRKSGDELNADMSSSFRGNQALSVRGGRHEENPSAGYCRLVIDPKVQKLQEKFGKYLK